MTIFEKTTNNYQVIVEPHYESDRSRPDQQLYVFSYHVIIRNNGIAPIQINKRSWTITDAFGNIQYIEGDGVIGQQPVILAGESFSYTSYCPLKTSFGTMKGHYYVISEAGKSFKIDIPEFILAHPHAVQ